MEPDHSLTESLLVVAAQGGKRLLLCDAAVLAPLVEREILWRLLTGPFGDVIRQISLPASNLSDVNRAIGWIRDSYAERMRISDLSRLSRMSPSAHISGR
ncbi:MAG TPA: AraC family transcriptional regulator N-terminal domain-containing protein [Streptosporangiaceae bacterium]